MLTTNLKDSTSAWILGVDLAWGERNGDGLCLLHVTRQSGEVRSLGHTFGDAALVTSLQQNIPEHDPALLLIDAPLVMINETGSRPVDRKTHELFHREHAGCYPANLTKCPRPARIGQLLQKHGFVLNHDLPTSSRLAAEVYPHPAMVRLFKLDQIVKYKKGAVAQKRLEFTRLQGLIHQSLAELFPDLRLNDEARSLLSAPWSKPIEDRTDALFCALIGYHHWLHRGSKSDPIGDVQTGFILLPSETRT